MPKLQNLKSTKGLFKKFIDNTEVICIVPITNCDHPALFATDLLQKTAEIS